uniref:T-box transcription factor TBX6-like isoform X1 n=1 Tax=Diabrotica virgifera virgifera TaxID=50390 RepID=A0A6P7FQK4_DIAVI
MNLGPSCSNGFSGISSFMNDFGPALQCQVVLKNQDLWKKFYVHETEMIITKTGRRMFPSLQLEVKGLSPNTIYSVVLEMEPVCRNRFKYSASGGWLPSGSEEALIDHRYYIHSESPARGDFWMGQTISFSRVKLTNTFAPPPGQVVLSSMHKYQPKIIISQVCEMSWAPKAIFRFAETQFIAVTAYQNEKITQLKINYNPFAKGFRENGQAKYKRKQARAAKIVNVSEEEEEIIVVDSTVASTPNDRLSESSESSTSTVSCSTESQPRVETTDQDIACDILSPPVATSTPYPVVRPFEYRPVVHPRPMYRYNVYQPYPGYNMPSMPSTSAMLPMPAMPPMVPMLPMPPMPPMPHMPTMWSSNSVCNPPVMPFPGIQVPISIISPSTSASYPSPTYPDPMQPEATYFESNLAESTSQLTPSESGSSRQYDASESQEESQLDLSDQSMEVEVSHSERARTPELRPFGVSQLEASHSRARQLEAIHSRATQREASPSEASQAEPSHSAARQPAPSHSRVRQLKENHARVRQPQRKLTDFSIRAITGCE